MPVLYIYSPENSQGAQKLAYQIDQIGTPLGLVALVRNGYIPYDAFTVNWGIPRAYSNLNKRLIGNKFTELERMMEAGIPVPYFQRTKPPMDDDETVWLKRTFGHARANDLRFQGKVKPDYWVRRCDITEEFRIHVFKGRIVRCAVKEPGTIGDGLTHNENTLPPGSVIHPWIRSWECGWKMTYGEKARERLDLCASRSIKLRRVARAAVRSLGYDFGAVDLGIEGPIATGFPIVLEVNSRPGLDGDYTASAYARQIIKCWRRWRGMPDEAEVAEPDGDEDDNEARAV